jgi:two-component sensor histidine kinase
VENLFSRRISTRRWLVRYPRALPTAILLLVSAVTLLACYSIERVDRQRSRAALEERAGAVASALEHRANANASYLRAGAALFTTLGEVPAARFRAFVNELWLDADYGAEGIGWAQRVDRGQVDEFNRLMAQEYGPDVRLHPAIAGDKPYAVPVTFFEPGSKATRAVLGLDVFADPIRGAGMAEAERTARPTLTGKVPLIQTDAPNPNGFLMYMPVFGEQAGKQRLEGYVYSVFKAQDFLTSALQEEAAGNLDIRLYDREAESSRLMAQIETGQQGPSVQEKVVIGDHLWVLLVKGPEPSLLSGLSLMTLLFGLAVAGLLAALVLLLTQQATEDGSRLAWFEEQNAIRDSLTRELNHRVKNTLANVLSIVALTRRRASSIDEFADGLDGRIRALSATHDVLTQSDWGRTPVRAVIEAELAPYARESGPLIAIDGPEVELAPKDALSLGLAIHELATNATKYGALSVTGGRLSVAWGDAEDGRLRLEWVEQGGPPVPQERKRGFGTDLIERVVAHELESPVDLRFDPEGVRCVLVIPVRAPRVFALREQPVA